MEKVAIVDYGMSNLHSVYSALAHVADDHVDIQVTSDINEIDNADRVVFPGQGAAADCMRAISSLNLSNAIVAAANEKPFLGICMGMQVLLDRSDENEGTQCLGMYKGTVRNFTTQFDAQQLSFWKT